MRDLFTEHSTVLVGGIVAVLLLMRIILPLLRPGSGSARAIIWFWHPEGRALVQRRLFGRRTKEQIAADDALEVELFDNTLSNMNSTLAALALVFFVIRPFVVQAFFIPTASMYPTLWGDQAGVYSQAHRQDRVLVNRYVYHLREPRRQEIIVFRAPPAAGPSQRPGKPDDFIKRLIALPGDTIEVRANRAFVNGQPLNEPYINLESANSGGPGANFGPVTLPPGKYFVMGDNRGNSLDSRLWVDPVTGQSAPFISRRDILGKAMCVFWPLRAIRLLKPPPAAAPVG